MKKLVDLLETDQDEQNTDKGFASFEPHQHLTYRGEKLEPSLRNAVSLLRDHPDWAGVLTWDQFSLCIRTRKPAPWTVETGTWSQIDDLRATEWLQKFGVNVGSNICREAIKIVADERRVHPVREWMLSLKWDRKERIGSWLTNYAGAQPTKLNSAIGRAWLISGIARIMQPGAQADYVLCLEGPQGIRKSTLLRELTGDAWFSDHLSDFGNKDSRIELAGRMVVELGELSNLRRAEIERVKSFLTCRVDHYRAPYDVRAEAHPRQCIFAATYNDSTPFSDVTGGRRFWPVECGTIDADKMKRDREQLWAEAMFCYQNGEVWWLTDAELNRQIEQEQSQRTESSPWEDIVLSWLSDPQAATATEKPLLSVADSCCTVTELLIHAIHKPVDHWTRGDEMAVSGILKKHKWKRKARRMQGRDVYFYYSPKVNVSHPTSTF